MNDFKPVLGYETRYEVSQNGLVRSKTRIEKRSVNGNVHVKSRVMSVYEQGGYLRVGLTANKKQNTYQLHRVVYEAFKGKIPNGLTINHIDGNKLNNNIANLEAITIQENVKHRDDNRLGYWPTGEDSKLSKITQKQADEIRESDKPQRTIAREYGVSQRLVWNIKHNKTWRIA